MPSVFETYLFVFSHFRDFVINSFLASGPSATGYAAGECRAGSSGSRN
jgi:hypothetical protein